MIARKLVAVFGLVVLCLGLFVTAVPNAIVELSRNVLSPTGVAIAGGGRVAIGIILWLASGESRTPRTFKVIGVLAVLGGITVWIIGVSGLTSIVAWGSSKGDAVLRGVGVVSACLGAFLAWSAMPPKGAE